MESEASFACTSTGFNEVGTSTPGRFLRRLQYLEREVQQYKTRCNELEIRCAQFEKFQSFMKEWLFDNFEVRLDVNNDEVKDEGSDAEERQSEISGPPSTCIRQRYQPNGGVSSHQNSTPSPHAKRKLHINNNVHHYHNSNVGPEASSITGEYWANGNYNYSTVEPKVEVTVAGTFVNPFPPDELESPRSQSVIAGHAHQQNGDLPPPHVEQQQLKNSQNQEPRTDSEHSLENVIVPPGFKPEASHRSPVSRNTAFDDDDEDEEISVVYASPEIKRSRFLNPYAVGKDETSGSSELANKEYPEQYEAEDNTPCAVCLQIEPEPNNEMIFCDSCNVCVHQACYGVQPIPTESWKCSPCKEGLNPANIRCYFCPKSGGALKRVKSPSKKHWGHMMCALWIPEVKSENVCTMEPICRISDIPDARWKLKCGLCKEKEEAKVGVCIQCQYNSKCCRAFHVTCAFEHGLKMDEIVADELSQGIVLKAYCKTHTCILNGLDKGQGSSDLNRRGRKRKSKTSRWSPKKPAVGPLAKRAAKASKASRSNPFIK